jgi:hypothetical protein
MRAMSMFPIFYLVSNENDVTVYFLPLKTLGFKSYTEFANGYETKTELNMFLYVWEL